MPKKTKKQKILAAYRKKLQLIEQSSSYLNKPSVKIEKPTEKNEEVKIETNQKELLVINQYFFSDLRKSLFLTVFIIALEIGLYFANLIK